MAFAGFAQRLGTAIGGIILSLALIGGPAGALAQDAPAATPDASAPPAAPSAIPAPDSVLATVGGAPITEADLGFAAEDLGQQLANVPPEKRRAYVMAVLIDMKVMANAARAGGMTDSDDFKRRLGYLEDRVLRRLYFSNLISDQVTPEAIQQAYQKMVADFKPKEEIHARHILVASKEEAEKVKSEIEGGTPFEIAAMENSTDGSAQKGGDLGYFSRGRMVPAFEKAAFALKVGEISDPVQSQFGWHIIELEDRRMSSVPKFTDVQGQLQQQLLIEAFNTDIKALKTKTEISFTDPAMAAAVAAETQQEESN